LKKLFSKKFIYDKRAYLKYRTTYNQHGIL